MNKNFALMVLSLFHIKVVLKALKTMKTLVFGNLLSKHTVFPFFVLEGKQERDS